MTYIAFLVDILVNGYKTHISLPKDNDLNLVNAIIVIR